VSAVKLRPPPSVADTPTFDRWIRESLLGFLAAGNTEGPGAGLQPLDSDLTAIAALTGTGIAVRTGADTWALQSAAQNTGEILVDDDMNILFDDDGDVLYEA